ncbi:Pyruvate phosphate dikinase, PEP/pyruvate binding domain protein [Synechococcus sp. PCC 7335]|uniref:glycerol-3-phosphate acyltransferase n=1 Tax=Synechococcus sp. (strain ATCC 29403 / PCC 7335) TaxID=91464 RepID=UPI00017EDC75|nr:glycerol-3-phosphate acyltransferase [Synechococcus sp. PCC 7335]EDX85651.1 Pyruvate phosphate dikinase, PEP/pyruvate binding domain protein [Synechococcus sp. PCC 7335]
MAQVLGALLIFTLVPLLGALPLTGWIVRAFTGKNLRQLGTGNISVSAAFYHGGTLVGVLAVLAEAFKGIFSILLARYFFGGDAVWPIISLMFIVMGRYWGSQGAGTTNVAWGFFVYDPVVAGLTFLISLISFTLLRMRDQGKLFVLVLMPVLTALRHPTDGMRILVVACLSGLVAWIYSKIPNDLDLIAANSAGESRRMFRFFQGDRALPTLSQPLEASKVGPKAATLSQLHALGYPVPPGYVLPAGDDPAALIKAVFPNPNLTTTNPTASTTATNLSVGSRQPASERGITVVARSSATGEDSLNASAAGQYVSVTEITSPQALERAITVCLNAYNAPSAIRYRQDRNLPEGRMNVLVQPHIFGTYSGVAFSRDPVTHIGDTVVVEALPGDASRVVSGQITPERYQVNVGELPEDADWHLPEETTLPVEGHGQVPNRLIQRVAYLARHLEDSFHGIPQDIEWTFDGQQLWVLQSRPVTTLIPIWTRKIAAEVIPGAIRPLTWSINRPLTCGVWGDLFTTVLKRRAEGIDFSQTATLHYARAYFNATLLGDIFTRMGLPPDSLEFLTRGAKFQRPPLMTTLQNLPGLLRLAAQENGLPSQFAKADSEDFSPALARWQDQPAGELTESAVVERIEEILALLKQATYYNILAPLSVALRQAILKVDLASLDSSKNPEVRALEEIKQMAVQLRSHLSELGLKSPITSDLQTPNSSASLFAALAEHPDGHLVFDQIDRFLDRYGYLSEVATDIAVPTWRESPQPVRELLTQYLLNPKASQLNTGIAQQSSSTQRSKSVKSTWKSRQVQTRLDLKGRVAEVYDRLLATLRSCFVELESRWLSADYLESQGDLFFLTWSDIRTQITNPLPAAELRLKIHLEKARWESQKEQRVPYLIYGQTANTPLVNTNVVPASAGVLKGIGASAGQAEGNVHVLETLSGDITKIDTQTILVVPYTDAGWSPLLARIGGLIAEVGGQLSHGAIIAREYGIPAVMNVNDATQKLTTGQRVRIDGQNGTVEIL